MKTKTNKKINSQKKQNFKNKITDFIKKNIIFIILYIISTTYFVYENLTTISWDLSVYVLNAQHIFAESIYVEIGRPPMVSLIIGILGVIFTWKAAEILFVIITSTLFAYSIYFFSKSIKFNHTALYALSLNIYVFMHGLFVGTEILSLSLLIIAITLIIKNNVLSGIFIGLTGLTRYTALAIFPLIIFHYDIKKIIKSLALFGVTITAWLTYNYFAYGNMFESVASQYALNVISRQGLNMSINLQHFLNVINILLPFFILGLIITIKEIINDLTIKLKTNKNKIKLDQIKKFFQEKKHEIIILTILIYTIHAYTTTPLKLPRYLFFLVLPTIYFSYRGIEAIVIKIKKKKSLITKIALLIFAISILLLLTTPIYRENEDTYIKTIQKLDELNVSHCYVASNVWPFLNYLGTTSEQFPRLESIQETINDGKIIHLFKSVSDPDYTQNEEFMNTLPIIYEDNQLYVIGNKNCTKATMTIRNNYLQEINKSIYITQNYEPNINPCFIMFKNYGIIERTCNFIHKKGFTQDENRALW